MRCRKMLIPRTAEKNYRAFFVAKSFRELSFNDNTKYRNDEIHNNKMKAKRRKKNKMR